MPAALTYPGVYVEEIPSGVRTITGVATSITAFVGRALRGPVNQALTVNSFGDFEANFGSLWNESSLGFAVRDFFLNGGGQAVIVRLYRDTPAADDQDEPASTRKFVIKNFALAASNPGTWGNGLRVSIDRNGITQSTAQGLGVPFKELFNLTVRDTATGRSERHLNLTVSESARRLDRVLATSGLIRDDGSTAKAGDIKTDLEALDTKYKAISDFEQQIREKLGKVPPEDVGAEQTALAAARKALSVALGTYQDDLSKLETVLAEKRQAVADLRTADPSADVTNEKAAVDTAKGVLDKALDDAGKAVSDGDDLTDPDFLPPNGETEKKGLYALEQVDLFNLLCLPPYRDAANGQDVTPGLVSAAASYCEKRRAMLLLDSPSAWTSKQVARDDFTRLDEDVIGTRSRNAALIFPRLRQPNPLRDGQMETFAACGAVAGVFARTDANRGVWKAPAGLDATLVGVPQLSVPLTDAENGELNPLGINCLRSLPATGRVVWGARTLRGADQLADEYKYTPVRRTALYIEESLFRGLKWVVFEPNDEPLWAQIRLNVGAFMHNLFRQGAFQGSSPRDAYFVRCDKDTTTQNDINLGVVNVVVGFAPLKPAEFVVLRIQQIAGQIDF